MSLDRLHRRIDALLTQIEQQDDNDAHALDIINRSLCQQLEIINSDGTLPVDFGQRSALIEQGITPAEQHILDQFERRYHGEGEVAAMLQELEQ